MKSLTSVKNITLTGLGMIFIVFFLSSCRKELQIDPNQPKTIKNLKVAPDFDWKTSREITLNIVGLKEVNPNIANTLYVNSLNGATFYKDLLTMHKDYTIKFGVPSTETSLVLKYGSKVKTVQISSNTIIFDYIIE
jgi:hypothetical protein